MTKPCDLIFDYFPQLTTPQKEQYRQLEGLYLSWNANINIISRKDIGELYLRHVLHSLGIAKIISFNPGADILDAGTGGGFPGIPLAIMFPSVRFLLVDSIGKKIKVVQSVADSLGLDNVKTGHIRAEQVDGKFDFVVSRAVTRLQPFHRWVAGKFKPENRHRLPNGIICLKGGNLDEELKEIKKECRTFHLADYFEERFFETKKGIHVPG